MQNNKRFALLLCLILFLLPQVYAQINWAPKGNSYYKIDNNEIVQVFPVLNSTQVLVSNEMLTPAGGEPLKVRAFELSEMGDKALIYTNAKKVWRLPTEGDYWVVDLKTKKLHQLGVSRPASSLRFAKFSPDGSKVAYVSEYNVYVEEIPSGVTVPITRDGNRKLINGTFDWAYEEEFACRDGFQWSPDGARIAFWQIDARQIPDYDMINTADSVYSQVIPVEYPTAGRNPSPARIGVVKLSDSDKINWLNIPGDPAQHYLPRMEWNTPTALFVQQLNRKQNESKILNCDVVSNTVKLIYQEQDAAWIDVLSVWENVYGLTFRHAFKWLKEGREFLWMSEKDGWRHLYRIDQKGKETLITTGKMDVMNVLAVNEKDNLVYFAASPDNATQQYLYQTKLDGSGTPERVTPAAYNGTNTYSVSATGE